MYEQVADTCIDLFRVGVAWRWDGAAAERGQGGGCVFEREKKAEREREREEGGKEGIEFDKETLWEPFNLTLSTFI